ncbi:MAG: FAD-dependent oxidoreductase, partial [Syntrophales bacterium]
MTEARTGALFMPRTYASTESNKTGSWRYLRPRYEEKTAPCSTGCPAGEDIGTIEMLTAQGLFKEAWEKILIENPFPAVCGRVCYHPCEAKCNRREFDSGVAIRILERFLADTASRYELKPSIERSPAKKQKIAVAGAGPSGLTAAFFLTVLGYKCDVFESMPEPGGVLRWAIPGYRLPPAALKNEIARIENLGISIRTGKPVSWASIEEARGNYDAVFIGCGHPRTAMINFPGEDSAGMVDGMEFLRKVRGGGSPPCEGLSAVIGGGNTAMDVARSIVRLGGKAVILYRRRRQDMPAFEEEISMALDEGVELKELLAPVRLTPDSGGYLLTMQHMKVTGEDEKGRALIGPDGSRTLDFRIQRVFKATGAEAAEEWQNPPRKGQ